LYHQLYNALEENVTTVYGAMMDEMDEVRIAGRLGKECS
jgi:hypothetical protein